VVSFPSFFFADTTYPKKIAVSVPSQGVELGWNAQPRCMAAQPGGMSADILLAHFIAAAKVRRQSL
jgi:hypothetical protein